MASHVQPPRVTKRERKLHLSYELPHRIHCSIISPLTAPNGSTLILYGHARGLRILWRGGRRRRKTAHSKGSNGTNHLIDDDDEDDFEEDEEEEEQDPDCPYPSIIQHLDVGFGGTEDKPVAALHLATTTISASSAVPRHLKSRATVVAASSDGKLRVLHIPLAPPADDAKDEAVRDITTSAIELDTGAYHVSNLPKHVAVKFLSNEHQRSNALIAPNDDVEGYLLVASVGRSLNTWTIPVTADAILGDETDSLTKTTLPSTSVSVALHPAPRSSQIMLADASSAVRIYDPHAVPTPRRRPGSSDSNLDVPISASKPGKWVMTFHPAFNAPENAADPGAALGRRKKILDVKWVLGGRCALTLLEDGEWGVWDILNSPPTGKKVDEFAMHGFLGTATKTETAEPAKQRQGAARLAPSTPNTRKAKQEQLFTGAPKLSDAAPRGGISVSSNSSKVGPADESVIVWYNANVYSITSMGQFWQRSTSAEYKSLYASGLSHITDINLMNEEITSISQFASKAAGSGIGHMNTQRDFLVSAEHRAIILQSTRPPTPSRQLFQAAERPASTDQQMLDSGTLDLDGMDRMLDSMVGGAAPPARRVGFAS